MQQAVIRALMKVRPRQIRYDAEDGAIFREVFEHPRYRDLDETAQMALALEWAAKLYQIELEQPQFDQFFGSLDLQSHLAGAAMLDIGCYLGGRTVRWLERYRAAAIHGIDIDPRFIRVATRFAESRGARATFGVTFAEDLPHPDASFDAIISENTFEHVRDIRRVMAECARVLRPRGLLIVIFPPFWGPSSHHLDLVTRTPFLHWVFSYPALLKAYLSILDERGPDAAWYRRKDERPLPFERGAR
ncbi:MAG TPA: methyltransferase domain-containing protein [Candidatus Binatia bacterium]|nr:methyltransferase domain-containing protein [Candidatus Binatia bacterium]